MSDNIFTSEVINERNENPLTALWGKFFPFWPIFLVLIIAMTGIAALYIKIKVPVYQCSAKLIIKDDKKGIEDSKISESLNVLATKKIIENEIDVIKSRTLLNQVVLKLALYAPIFEAGKWQDKSRYLNSPVRIEARQPDSLKEIIKVFFEYDDIKKEIKIENQIFPLDRWLLTKWGYLKFNSIATTSLTKGHLYFSLVNPKRIVENLSAHLNVSPSNKLSTVVDLNFVDPDPKRGEDILNTLIENYDKASIDDKTALAQNTLAFLDERLALVKNDLDSIERRLQQYKSRKGAIDISSQGANFLKNVSENDQKLSEINMRTAVLKQVELYVSSKTNISSLVPSTIGISDPILSGLIEVFYKIELQREQLKRTTGENNPALTALSDQSDKLKISILENIKSQQESINITKANLTLTNGQYAASLQTLPEQERDLVSISREQNIKNSSYSFLLQKKEETAFSRSSIVSDTRIVDKAQSSLEPIGYQNKLVYGISLVIALSMGVLYVLGKEMIKGTILFRKEIEDYTHYPVIGEIGKSVGREPIVFQNQPSGFIADEFRLLRTSLGYLGLNDNKKTLLITSAVSGDGKSFIAANLGLSIALGGKKVILVEFDLKNPTLSIKLNTDQAPGISEYLNEMVDLNKIIQKTNNNPNLFLISAGATSSSPSELILNKKVTVLFEELKNDFDFIIIDTAPVGILSDAYILSRFCDATLYVIRHNHTPKRLLKRIDDNNKINKLTNLAIVFNGVKKRGFGNSNYSYGYQNPDSYFKSEKKINNSSKKYTI